MLPHAFANATNPSEIPNKIAFGVLEAAAAIGLSRAFIFEKIASGELRSFKIHNRRLIHAEDLTAFVDSYRNGNATGSQP